MYGVKYYRGTANAGRTFGGSNASRASLKVVGAAKDMKKSHIIALISESLISNSIYLYDHDGLFTRLWFDSSVPFSCSVLYITILQLLVMSRE